MELRLVRIWDRNYNLRGQQFVNWNNGFTIPSTDPMAVELWENREIQHQITVESTNELAWYIDRLDRMAEGALVVTCRPHLDVLRQSIRSDAYLVDLWLDAEDQWKATRRMSDFKDESSTLKSDPPISSLRDRIAYALAQADGDEPGMEPDTCDYELAGAVMRALGLQTHLAKRIINGKPDQWVRRYVTDWEIVDE